MAKNTFVVKVTFKAFIKLFKAPQRSVKIKMQVIFFSSSVIGTGRVENTDYTKLVKFDTTSIIFCVIHKTAKRKYARQEGFGFNNSNNILKKTF